MDNVTDKIISILCFIFILTNFYSIYKSKQEQKRLKQKAILKTILLCSNKVIYSNDIGNEIFYIRFNFKEECFECSVPIELFENIETGEKIEAEFYINETDDYTLYDIKSINGVEIPLRDCKKYIEY